LLGFLIVAIALTAIVHSARFHNYVLSEVQKRATDTLGAQGTVAEFRPESGPR